MKQYLSSILLIITFSCSAGVTDWIEFNLEGGHIKMPINIAGIDTYAILDTGAQLNAINKAFITKHQLAFEKGRKIEIKGVYGIERKTTFNDVPVNFFGIKTKLNNLAEISIGHHTNGLLLGAGLFSDFITQLDYPNKKMRLITQDSIDITKFKNIEMQSQKGTGMPIVKINLPDDKYLWLLLDTGNAGGMVVKRKVAKKMGWLEKTERKSTISIGVNSMVEAETFRVPQLQFGPFKLENVLVTIPAEGESSNLENQYQKTGSRIKGKKVQGLVGYDVLKHFLITIDYKGGHAHIGLPDE
ncbi:retropepsin-like aspartic protease [Litorilituus sediminis]|uniref:Signal protein PDZ n=1 Tax=Litorilituus sediminis TaxID=718192 RepID=A0A4P6P6R4_9GAMM|nr:retropepsin-like aspartic protease [Litorilituus sediminis]QBG37184.1 signal protein PDZ [Litorilituus sediminis]